MKFYSILFSLDGRPDYAYCLALLIKSLERCGTLKDGDTYYLICDERSYKTLSQLRTRHIKPLIVPTPLDAYEGMMLKYQIPLNLFSPDDVVVYLDADMLGVRPFRPELPPDTLVAYPEGNPEDTNYKGDFNCSLRRGMSAGFFAFRPGPRVAGLFTEILDAMRSDRRAFYCLDQPYYNRALASRDWPVFNHDLVSFNGHTSLSTCAFLNMCGEPGDGQLHATKMLSMFLQLM